jgi:hypothetical protein
MDSVLLGGTAGPIELRIILSASAYGEATVDSYNTLWVETAALSGSGYNYLGEPQSGEVPEPSTFLLLASGLAAGALFHRRTTGKK